MTLNCWRGVDLDGTLAEYHGWLGVGNIGKPIHSMLQRVNKWIEEGETVKIFTARVCSTNPEREEEIKAIQEWSLQHIGIILEVTAEKDYGMIELWDDRCIRVEHNTGRIYGS